VQWAFFRKRIAAKHLIGRIAAKLAFHNAASVSVAQGTLYAVPADNFIHFEHRVPALKS